MSYSKISYSSRKHGTDIKYEHVIRSTRGLSMANETNPDAQQDNRLKLELKEIEKQRQVVERERVQLRTQTSLPAVIEPPSALKRANFAQDRLNRTLQKYGLPILRKSATAPSLRAPPQRSMSQSTHKPSSHAACCISPTRTVYSRLCDPQSYSDFCSKLVPLHLQNEAMKCDITEKTRDHPEEAETEEPPPPHSSPSSTPPLRRRRRPVSTPAHYLRYCDDMNVYLRDQARWYNHKAMREEQEELHNWEAYRRSCPLKRHIKFVKGPDISQLSYLSFQ